MLLNMYLELMMAIAHILCIYACNPCIMPAPNEITTGSLTVAISNSLVWNISHNSFFVNNAIHRFKNLVYANGCSPKNPSIEYSNIITNIRIKLNHGTTKLIEDLDESYSLLVPQNGTEILILASNIFGAIRALESLTQLIKPTERIPSFVIMNGCKTKSLFIIDNAPIFIHDKPAYVHRGFLLDTSRNYIPKKSILMILDGMAASKLNVFHWHIVDSQSFPIESEAVPDLTKGAYSSYEIYSKKDVSDIIRFAHYRGIRVIPEFDIPGHTYSWGIGNPGLILCPDAQPWTKFCAQPPCGQLDISKNETYFLLKLFLNEMASWFTDYRIHLGSDEVNENCYLSDPGIQKYLNSSKSTLNDLLQKFQDNVQNIVRSANKSPIFWEEVILDFPTKVPKDTIIQVWRGQESIRAVLDKGYKVIVSNAESTYLDCGRGSYVSEGSSWCDPFKSWIHLFNFNPGINISSHNLDGILGGESAMWTELIDENNLMDTVFPRLAAFSESLWTSSKNRSWKEASYRMSVFRNHLVNRGIKCGPIWPSFCSKSSCFIN